MSQNVTYLKDAGTYVGEPVVDYVKPAQLVESMIEAGTAKGNLPLGEMLVRGALGGAFLAYSTSMAFYGVAQGMTPVLAALLFPLGFVIINLIQADVTTGYFCYVPVAFLNKRINFRQVARALSWIFTANLIGSVAYGFLFWAAVTMSGAASDTTGISAIILKTATAKTIHYQEFGFAGIFTAFLKGVLCNWLVTLGVILPMTTRSAVGRAVATFVPIYMFFAMGWEHSVVNMFIMPTAMLFNGQITMGDWWLWNEIPVTIGNFCGGFLLTGLAISWAYYARKTPERPAQPAKISA